MKLESLALGFALRAWGSALRAPTPHVDPTRRSDKSLKFGNQVDAGIIHAPVLLAEVKADLIKRQSIFRTKDTEEDFKR